MNVKGSVRKTHQTNTTADFKTYKHKFVHSEDGRKTRPKHVGVVNKLSQVHLLVCLYKRVLMCV
jgi:hypothetical protein